MIELGLCYFKGIGTENIEALAFKWHKQAAENNHIESMFSMGVYYFKGICGVAKKF